MAQLARISLDTVPKIERGAIASPAFFTVAALARVLDLDLTALADALAGPAVAAGTPGGLGSAA